MVGLSAVVSLLLMSVVLVGIGVGFSELGVKGVLSGASKVSLGVQDLMFEFCYGSEVSPMAVVVVAIFMMVLVFTMVYMVGEVEYNPFLAFVASFVVGMLILVTARGVYSGLVGWELLGVISFVLIGYYGTRSSWGSALVTMVINRGGDVSLMLMLLILALLLGGLNGSVLGSVVGLLGCTLVLTKSSQFPCSGWLPLAMAAPTPVSALVHSSTLVVAGLVMGVYLWGIMGVESTAVGLCLLMGIMTLTSSSISVLWEMDFKEVVALSTSIHLSVMLLMLVASGTGLAMMHMAVHALFKSLLFVAVGVIILMSCHDQDYRGVLGLGGEFSAMMGVVVLSSVWSLLGLMGFSGWVTKDTLLESVYLQGGGLAVVMVVVVALSCSMLYGWKLVSISVGGGSVQSLNSVGWGVGSSLLAVMGVMSVLGVSVGGLMNSGLDSSAALGVISGLEKGAYWIIGVMIVSVVLLGGLFSPVGANMMYLQDLYQVLLSGVSVLSLLLASKVEYTVSSVVAEGAVEVESSSLQAMMSLVKSLDMWAAFVGMVIYTLILTVF
uniref:NADH:ubiquinone reductase (H(+)-translocating) n=1 Tax=Pomphorhynchus sp. TP-2012 TaxID=1184605 RepID=A0A806GRN2_9BILA|nr:NADH dehydrogenase subunit 5 [Pomphorhynchus sp. TP-2012]